MNKHSTYKKAKIKHGAHFRVDRPEGDAYEIISASDVTASMSKQISNAYIIGIVEKGYGDFIYRDEKIHITSSSLVLLQANEPFSRHGDIEHPRSVRMLLLKPSFFKELIFELTQVSTELPIFNQVIDRDPELVQQFSTTLNTLSFATTADARKRNLLTLTQHLLKHHIIEFSEINLRRHESERIKHVREFLTEHYMNPVSLNELAELVGLSPNRLNRVFAKEIGVPPHAFLNQVRLKHAKKLIEQGCELAQAAYQTGFYDQAHLTRHFKRVHGYTPGIIQRDKNVQ